MEAAQIVETELEKQGFSPKKPEKHGEDIVVRFAIRDHVCGSVTLSRQLIDSGESAIKAAVLDACRAAVTHPAARSEIYAA